MKILEAIDEYGSCIAVNEDYGLMVTVNGSYFNVWVNRGEDDWENTEAFAMGDDMTFSKEKFVKIVERGEDILEDVIKGDEEDEEDED